MYAFWNTKFMMELILDSGKCEMNEVRPVNLSVGGDREKVKVREWP